MKKILVFVILLFIPIYAYAGDELIKVVQANYPIFINGIKMQSTLPILNADGNTYIPLRKVTEEMGYKVNWDNDKKIVEINKEDPAAAILEEFEEAVSEEIEINGLHYRMSTQIAKDDMPGANPTYNMIVNGITVCLMEEDGKSFNSAISIKKVWIESNHNLMEIKFTGQGSIAIGADGIVKYGLHSPEFSFQLRQSNGRVNVYAKIFDEVHKKYYLIKANNQEVVISN